MAGAGADYQPVWSARDADAHLRIGAGVDRGWGINTDDRPLLEYQAPKALYVGQAATRVWENDLRQKPGNGLLIESYRTQRPPTRDDLRRLIYTLTDYRASLTFIPLEAACRAYLDRWPDDPEVANTLAWRLEESGQTTEALHYATIAANGGSAHGKKSASSA